MLDDLKSPFRERQNPEKELISEEIKAVLGAFELTRRLRAKNPDHPEDVDKSREDTNESVGDHVAMVAYLMHYFLPLLEEKGLNLDYQKTLDMVLAQDIVAASELPHVAGINKSPDYKRQEIISTAKVFNELPKRDGFNIALFEAYGEYLGRETPEARFVRAVNGMETMLYVLSKPPHVRERLVKERGYSLSVYHERVGAFCGEFPPLQEFYKRITTLFECNGYFAEHEPASNGYLSPREQEKLLKAHAPEVHTGEVDVDAENEGLLLLQKLRRKLCFSSEMKPKEEYDTVAEHTVSMVFLTRYFHNSINEDMNKSLTDVPLLQKAMADAFSLRTEVEMVLGHDAPEAITGDIIAPRKTIEHMAQEKAATAAIADKYAPRAGGFNDRFRNRIMTYELSKNSSARPSDATLVKALDILDTQFYILDPDTREKLAKFKIVPDEMMERGAGKYLHAFPIVDTHFKALRKKIHDAGLI